MKFYSFGGISFPTAYQDQDMPIDARSNLVELPGGAFDEDGQQVTLRPSLLTYRFPVDSSIDATIDALLAKLAQGRLVLKTVLRNGTSYRQTFAKLVSVNRARAPLDKLVQQVELTLSQSFPYWFDSSDEPYYLDHGKVLDDTPSWNLDGNYTAVTLNASTNTATITPAGTVPVLRGKIIIRPAGGSAALTSIIITNQTNWKILRFLGTLSAGEVLVIDLLAKSAKVNETNAYSSIDLPVDQMDWMQLEVGANAIVIDVTSPGAYSAAFEWHWADTFI